MLKQATRYTYLCALKCQQSASAGLVIFPPALSVWCAATSGNNIPVFLNWTSFLAAQQGDVFDKLRAASRNIKGCSHVLSLQNIEALCDYFE
jgi:hypothetical protein